MYSVSVWWAWSDIWRQRPEYNLGFDPYGICDDPNWVPATTVYTVDWDNETLEPMPAQDLWEFLKKHKDALHSSRADGRVMCRWSGCTKGLVKKLELRRHVRVEHQLIAKWCTNKGCTFWDWDDAFHHKHRTCPCGPSGRFELKLVDPLFVARFTWL